MKSTLTTRKTTTRKTTTRKVVFMTIDEGFAKKTALWDAYDRATDRAARMPVATERQRLDRSCAFIKARLKYEPKIFALMQQLSAMTR